MRFFILKIVLFVFSVGLFGSFTIKRADRTTCKGYVLVRDGVYMYKDANETSRKTEKLPYNAEVQILEESSKQFNAGILSCHWLKISYKGKTGYCPKMYLYKNKMPDTSTLEHMGICDFLKRSNSTNEFNCYEKPDSMSLVDSVFINGISLENSYYYIRLLLDDKLNMPMPFIMDTTEYHFDKSSCQLEIKKTLSEKGSIQKLLLSWYFDGGLSETTFEKTDKGVSVKIGYYPD